MAGTVSEESGVVGRSTDGILTGQHGQSSDALAEWRSSEQVESGTPSTSPPYWDTDDDDDGGLKPSELYGKYTWKIEKFSQINKRELRSNAFEVGGYKWYILIYPQGCDVCNHLSLFLCVANHDKLLPGWSHFAQFTIAVVNKDPKKSKYSDTLHRFWKKEHDWGWKKFMELSKVVDGFIDSDTLIIKAQVQVIREKADRPFRCLDSQYRRELVRVYLTNVEQICRRFVEDRRGKLGKLIEDKARWSSFSAFWLGIDQNSRRLMSREKADVILKVVVKHFFIEKEVTSTLVMDSLHSGLKALEGQTIGGKKGRGKLLQAEEMTAPIVHVEKDSFALVDDVLLLLERAAVEPLPPKDEKGPQNRTKDGNSGEDFNKDSIERDEKRLTELGRRTVEIFVLAHIFSNKIEVSYQEAVALKRQEELIREEEASWQAESEQKAKRAATEKEKKLRKKQAKQKRNNRKGKDKGREDKSGVAAVDKNQEKLDGKDSILENVLPMLENVDVSDVSDSVDEAVEIPQPDSEDRDASQINWDTDTSEVHPSREAYNSGGKGMSLPNGTSERRSPFMDDSSSTCSTDSVPSVVVYPPSKGSSSFPNSKYQKSLGRGKNQRSKVSAVGTNWTSEMDGQPSGNVVETGYLSDVSAGSKAVEFESDTVVRSIHDQTKGPEQHGLEKKLSNKDQVYIEKSGGKSTSVTSSRKSPHRNVTAEHKLDFIPVRKTSSNGSQQTSSLSSSQITAVSKPKNSEAAAAKPIKKPAGKQMATMSRPSSAPIVPDPKPTVPIVSITQAAPVLARSVSAAGRLGPDPSPTPHSFVPQSYRNAILGNTAASSSAGFSHPNTPSSGVNSSKANSQQPVMVSVSMFLPHRPERIETGSMNSGFSFGMVPQEMLHNETQWAENSQRDSGRDLHHDPTSILTDIQNLDLYSHVHSRPLGQFTNFPAGTSGRQTQGMLADEFPHLDIINDLLDDELVIGDGIHASTAFQSTGNGPHTMNRQFSFPGDMSMSSDAGSSCSSCRFDRTHSYREDGFRRGYSSSGTLFESARDFVPNSNPLLYVNGQIDGLVPNHWQMAGSDPSLLGMRHPDGDAYPYYSPHYSTLSGGVNGYPVYWPSNGH